jgi:hypothetical protein
MNKIARYIFTGFGIIAIGIAIGAVIGVAMAVAIKVLILLPQCK